MALGDYPLGQTPLGTEYPGRASKISGEEFTLPWDVIGFVVTDFTLPWDVEVIVSADELTLKWDAEGYVMQSDFTLNWDIVGYIKTGDFTLNWDNTGRGGRGNGCCPPPVFKDKEICN